jgi:tetratricopeptide (TPR) repeat protein
MLKKTFVYYFALIIISFYGCKSAEKNVQSHPEKKISNQAKTRATSLFFDGINQKALDNKQQAIQLFSQSINLDPQNDAAYFELARLFNEANDYHTALAYAEKASQIDGDNKWYLLLLADLNLKNEKYSESVKIYNKLIKNEPENSDYYQSLASVYIFQAKYAEAVEVYNRLEQKIGKTEEITAQKQKIYLFINKLDNAANELQQLIQQYPGESRYYSMLAELYMNNKMQGKAFPIYKKILEIEPDNPYIHISLSEYYRQKGDKENFYNELKLGFANSRLDLETKIHLLVTYFNINELNYQWKDEAFSLVKILIETHPGEPAAHALYADFLVQEKKYSEARNEFKIVLASDSSRYIVWEQLIRLEAQLNNFEAVARESENALVLFVNQPVLYLFNGVAHFQLKNYQQATDAFLKGIPLVVGDSAMLIEFNTYLGDAYYQLKNYAASDEFYEKSLALNPDNTYVLNNYSYYLALRDERLDKAENMARHANAIEPDNASYQDTYAWVLYKLGRLAEAKSWMEKALQKNNNSSPVMLEHFGDILFKLNDTENAILYWEKAHAAGKGSEFLLRKIKDRNLYE